MFIILLILSVVLNVTAIVFLWILLQKQNQPDPIGNQLLVLKDNQERMERIIKEEIARLRDESNNNARQERQEASHSLKEFSDSLLKRLNENATFQKNQLDTFSKQLVDLTQVNEQKLESMRETVEKHLTNIQDDNAKKLEQIRQTVDEKLHETLEKRLGESFKLVSDRLELVHKGLGEMQNLATGVGDLKKVLTNVKTRGTWGEIQLGNLLDQILTPDQYAKNVATKNGSRDMVEFAIKLPGKDGVVTWLPVDAKFPKEDYEKLIAAQEQANPVLVEEISKALEARIKLEAKNIRDKYIDPPYTTDFGILFLPTEGLYAEVLRRPGLWEFLQREYRITITGPTTIAAFLNSLQMGFRTLVIEKRASEVWNLLSVVKTEFGKFGDILQKTHDKLRQASDSIEDATKKTRTIEQKLKNVQVLPVSGQNNLIENEIPINRLADNIE